MPTSRLVALKAKLQEQRKHIDELDKHMYVHYMIVRVESVLINCPLATSLRKSREESKTRQIGIYLAFWSTRFLVQEQTD